MNNFLVAVAVFVIAVLVAAFAIPRAVHWDTYRGVIEEEATRLLGRDVRVGGGVKIRLLPAPSFSVNRVTVADTEAGTGQPFFMADSLSGSLAVAPLLRGVFQATDIAVTRPEVHLVLDGDGGGNWKTIGQGSGQFPLQMSAVALDQVRIAGGVFVIHGPNRVERLRLEAIDGVLSAVALEGPFRFRGTFGAETEKRELRVSTGRQEADGSLRLKATLQMLDTGAVYNFDARAVDLARAPKVEGELSAKVAMPNVTGQPAQVPAQTKDAKNDAEAPLELRAALTADLKTVKLANLNLAFERQGRPQILTGEATIDLSRSVSVDARLAAKWLDLDQVIGAAPIPGQAAVTQTQGPVEGLLSLAQRLNGFSPDQGQASLVLEVEQANLGREAVSGLRMALAGKGAETDIREFRLGLPGGSQADIKGLMTGSGVETSFDGDVVLRGASLGRFLTWVSGGGIALDAARDGAFAMRSKISASPGAVAAREFTGELAGTIMQGELGYRWQSRPEVSVLIEGPRVDLRPIFGAALTSRASLVDLLTAASAFGAEARGGKTDAVLRVRAGELLLPNNAFTDAAIDLELRNGRLRVNRLNLLGDGGLAIDAEGDIPTVSSNARGTLRGSIAAADAAALRAVSALLALPADFDPRDVVAADIVPLRLAGSMSFASDLTQPVDFVVDGDARDTRIAAKVRLDKGAAAWRSAPLDAAVTLRGPKAFELLRRLTGQTVEASTQNALATPQLVTLHVAGTPSVRLATDLSIGEAGSRIRFSGRTDLDVAKPLNGEGRVTFERADARAALALFVPTARLDTPAARQSTLLSGQAHIEASSDRLRLEAIDANLGGVGVRGTLSLDAERTSVTGKLALTTVPALALLTGTAGATNAGADRGAIWPSTRFGQSTFGELATDVAITADRIELPGGIGLERAALQLVSSPGRVEVRNLEGRGAGGAWSGAMKLDSNREGSAASIVLRFKDVNPARIVSANGRVPLDASLSGVVTLNGRGQSPRELVESVVGRGSIALSDGRLAVLSPPGLTSALQTALRAQSDQVGPALRQSLAAFRATEPTLILAARSLELDVKAGVMSAAPLVAATNLGQTIGTVAVDLKTMGYTAQWRVDTTADPFPPPPGWTTTIAPTGVVVPRKSFVPLPPVQMTAIGSLHDLPRASVEIATDAIEREVAVRKVERDLEDLERLRKLDEERVLEEAERRRAAEVAPPAQAGDVIPLTGALGALPTGQVADPTEATAVPDTVDPSLRPRPAQPATVAPAPKPAFRPMTGEEHRRIFGGG